jgi:hypothetical protein
LKKSGTETVVLEETPWVLESKNEEEQMSKLALLFDVNSMKNSIHQDWEDLRNCRIRMEDFRGIKVIRVLIPHHCTFLKI